MKVPWTFGAIIPAWLLVIVVLVIAGFVVSLSGCASADFEYRWMKTRAAGWTH